MSSIRSTGATSSASTSGKKERAHKRGRKKKEACSWEFGKPAAWVTVLTSRKAPHLPCASDSKGGEKGRWMTTCWSISSVRQAKEPAGGGEERALLRPHSSGTETNSIVGRGKKREKAIVPRFAEAVLARVHAGGTKENKAKVRKGERGGQHLCSPRGR